MEIQIKNNRVYLFQANLGHDYVDMNANAILDQYGRVQVFVPPVTRTPSFYTSIEHLPKELVRSILDQLDNTQDNSKLTKLRKKMLRAFLTKSGE